MTLLYILLGLLALISIALVILLFNAKKGETEAETRRSNLEESLNSANQQRAIEQQEYQREMVEKNRLLGESEREGRGLSAQLAREQERVYTLTEQAKRDKEELEKLQESFRLEFRNLANEILEEKSTQFKKTNKEEIGTLLNPFKQSLDEFKKQVAENKSKDDVYRGELGEQLKRLHELNRKTTEETMNLTKALKGDSKLRGDWGEAILATILESSGLVLGTHYKVQDVFEDEAGNKLIPDVVIYLPDNKQIVIDSKVSLNDYVQYTDPRNAADQTLHLRNHLNAVRSRANELGLKSYQRGYNSPDFVIMFMPNEPAFLTALQHDSEIWMNAYKKKVVISSPTNLLALLKIVDDLWRRDDQSKNAIEIAERGGRLYDKFVGFVESLQSVGNSLEATHGHYDRAMRQLTGHGSLIRQTEMLRELGVNAKKSMPEELLDRVAEEEVKAKKILPHQKEESKSGD